MSRGYGAVLGSAIGRSRTAPLPAHQTKHLPSLEYPSWPTGHVFTIAQDDEQADSTGRTVWLGAQVLAVYLQEILKSEKPYKVVGGVKRRKRVIELGSGTGLLALTLHQLGYDVLATDVDRIATGLLRQNLLRNGSTARDAPVLGARTLDWFAEPAKWDWSRTNVSGSHAPDFVLPLLPTGPTVAHLHPPFDLIVTTDSIYDPALSLPLLRTLHALSSPPTSKHPPPIYLALEVRDPVLIDAFMESARADWGFKCSRVDHARLERLVGMREGAMGWQEEDWDGVQCWKLRWSGAAKGGSVGPQGLRS